ARRSLPEHRSGSLSHRLSWLVLMGSTLRSAGCMGPSWTIPSATSGWRLAQRASGRMRAYGHSCRSSTLGGPRMLNYSCATRRRIFVGWRS
ncbi:unnamed protein product, partial [Symbiodinium sp. KB8]